MKNIKRSIRRHHRARLVKKRKLLYFDARNDTAVRNQLGHSQRIKFADVPLNPHRIDTVVPCSCAMCCNPRRHGEKTLAEVKADRDYADQVKAALP